MAVAFVAAASHLLAGAALAATISSATFTGNGGTALVSGTFFARSGVALTLTVVTDTATNCVALTGAHAASTTTPTAVNGTKTWAFPLTAAAGVNGPRSTTVTAYDDDACAASPASVDRSYTIDNSGPTLSAALSNSANLAAWHNQNVFITWSATDAGSGVATGPTPATDSQTVNTPGATKASTATDRVGNVGNASIVIKLDKDVPLITANRNPVANANGWNNTNVTVSFTCLDTRSGIRSCTPTGLTSFTANGAGQGVTGTAQDFADNFTTLPVTVNIDKLAPTLSGAPAAPPNAAGWYNSDVTVHWTCADTGSSGFAPGACADTTISGEGTGLTSTKTVVDLAGNSSGPQTAQPAVNVDRTPPVTSASVVPGWTNQNVNVSLSAADGLSGVASTQYTFDGGSPQAYSGPLSFTTEGVHLLDFWSVDAAGNEEAHLQATVQIDRTAPTVTVSQSPPANSNGWNNTDVTVSFDCSDDASGVLSCSAPEVVSTEGASQQVSGNALDNAGNPGHANASVSIDKTAPTVSGSAAPAPNANGWNNTNVNVTFTCGDSLSGIATCPSATTLSEEGAGQSVGGTATDNAGNSAGTSVSGINVDKTAPSLSGAATTTPNSNGWYRTNVTVAWTCADALSGVAGGCPASSSVSGEGTNLSAASSVADRAGNASGATVSGLRIDRTAPTAAVAGVTAGATYVVGGFSASCSSSDGLSGVATPSVLSVSGGPTGAVTLSCTGAVDAAGNQQATPGSVVITVVSGTPTFKFGGFQRPLLAAPKVNTVKAGAGVPLKFSLGGFQGRSLFESGFPRSAAYACGSDPMTARSWVGTASNGGLSYDAASDTYSYIWKTDKGFAGTCRVFEMKLSDGSTQRALFRFDR